MDGTPDRLLRDLFQSSRKRERRRRCSTERCSSRSPRSQRFLSTSTSSQYKFGASDSKEDASTGRHAEQELFELSLIGAPTDTRVRTTRFGVEGLRVGRDPSCCDLVIPSSSVSRLHCVVFVLGEDVFVHDNSFNGTFINGHRVGRGRCGALRPRDNLSLINPMLEEASLYAFEFVRLTGPSGFATVEGLQRYKLGPVLGQGSFATVRLGIDRETKRLAAVKLIDRRRPFPEGASDSLHTEIEVTRGMVHPHVARALDAFEGDGCVALVMEYVRGGDLFDYIVGRGRNPFTEAEARHLFRQLLEAVVYIHSRGIIHCDLKPENVLVNVLQRMPIDDDTMSLDFVSVNARGLATSAPPAKDQAILSVVDDHQANASARSPYDVELKVTDFGSARYEGRVRGGGRSDTACGGTPVYAAPEIAFSTAEGAPLQEITAAVDVWSLGVLLYILCSGTVPSHPQPGALVAFNRSMDFLSVSCKDLITRMMTANPQHRPSLAEVCRHHWLENVPISGAPSGGVLENNDILSATTRVSPSLPQSSEPS